MKKRIFGLMLALCLCLTLLPSVALAETGTTYYLYQHSGNIYCLATPATGEGSFQDSDKLSQSDGFYTLSGTGIYQLQGDISLNAPLRITGTITLDLYGHVLQYKNSTASGSVIKVESGGKLTLKDSAPDATHRFTPNSDGLWVLDETNGTKTVTGGIITGGTGTLSGIGYYTRGGGVYTEGNFTMTGGSIVGCYSVDSSGGGVYVRTGSFNMAGGSIVGCTASRGGGVEMVTGTPKSTFTMSGTATIRSCTASTGGGVYIVPNTTMNANGGTITDCTANDGGAAVYNAGTITRTATGTTIDTYTTFDGMVTRWGDYSIIEPAAYPYNVTFNYNYTGSTPTTQKILKGQQLSPTREGYTFGGWYTDPGCIAGHEYSFTTADPGSITLYAKWTANSYAVNFSANGGEGTMGNQTFTYDGEQALNANSYTRTGYTFAGWARSETATTAEYTDQQRVKNLATSGEVVLYAVWTANSYDINYNLDGGTNADSNPGSYTYGIGVTSFAAPTRTGYTFDGWYDAPTGGNKVEHISDTQTDAVTLCAHWTAADYDITYDLDGGTASNPGGYNITNADITLQEPTKAGYRFLGWTWDGQPEPVVTVTIPTGSTGHRTYTAHWEKIDDYAWLLPVLGALDKEPFVDVKSGDWFYDDVNYVNEYGLMTGTGSWTFSPDAPVTRGMVMTILARREGIMTDRYSPWYAAGVEWAVVNGISDGSNPEAEITREELATMLYRYAKLRGYDLSGASLASYADAGGVSGYAVSAMQWAVHSGLINGAAGVNAGKLLPQSTATRAQLAAILHRFFG